MFLHCNGCEHSAAPLDLIIFPDAFVYIASILEMEDRTKTFILYSPTVTGSQLVWCREKNARLNPGELWQCCYGFICMSNEETESDHKRPLETCCYCQLAAAPSVSAALWTPDTWSEGPQSHLGVCALVSPHAIDTLELTQ